MNFSEKYRRPIRAALVWLIVLAPLAIFGLDMGVSLVALFHATLIFAGLMLIIMLRHPKVPTSTDMLAITFGMPILFLSLLLIYMRLAG